ncbi:MAG: rhodanese-like domain-containing protein, partial [Deltaproteobacteria bacterium]|nr:rhodanese-like domain-containing protein [Deltaproteobacteria bacterium]
DVDRPDDAGGGDLGEDAWDDVPPGDVTAEVCHPASVGWDTPLVMSPAEFHALLEAGDRILLNVFDDVIPQIAGTDAQLPWTDVPAIEEYLGHDLCADLAIYCRRGVRSTGVCATLAEHGYRFVRVLEGGVEAWQAAGYPVE